ncbi:unnamed protein product [Thelazia callipaeda]|uniref:V-type proton ATPase subunit C n=1 Tax=Thelazia callipaeda TaxID=103827 RepID=A0A0N5CUW5_THECL|nr:unnamed protein product [Thelazia callipaeda]
MEAEYEDILSSQELFIIASPSDRTEGEKLFKFKKAVSSFTTVSSVNMPSLEAVSRCELHELSRDMQQLDYSVENLLQSLVCSFAGLLERQNVYLFEHIKEQKESDGSDITEFIWDEYSYPPEKELSVLSMKLYRRFHDIDRRLRRNADTFENNIKIAAGYQLPYSTLASRNLIDLIPRTCVIDTDYIQSVFVAVPKLSNVNWLSVYQSLHESVVAGSSCFIAEDEDYKLYSAVIVRHDFEEFRRNCAKYQFIVRRYPTDDDQYGATCHREFKFYEVTHYQNKVFVDYLKAVVLEIFDLILHIKVLRAHLGNLAMFGGRVCHLLILYPEKDMESQLQQKLREAFDVKKGETNEINDTFTSGTCPRTCYLIYKMNLKYL